MKFLIPHEHSRLFFAKKEILFLFILISSNFLFAQNATNGGTISSDQTICLGEIPDPIINQVQASGGGATPIEYLWMTTNNIATPLSGWSEAAGVNNQDSYSPPILNVTTYYIRCARRQGFTLYPAETNIVTITVENSPTAIINGNPGTSFVGQSIPFNASTAINSSYSWDFNNDGIIDCTDQNCNYTFGSPGTYTISLTVDNGTCSITTTTSINLQNPYSAQISDPCSCSDPANYFDMTDYYVHDYILIHGPPNQTWTISNFTQGALFDIAGAPIPAGTTIPELGAGTYYLNIWFLSGTGYFIDVSNGSFILNAGTSNPCNCFNPLPVNLTSFNAIVDNGIVNLEWTTASETDNSHFEVERSLNGSRFDYVGVMEGSGTTSTPQYYHMEDSKSVVGETYYRLKQVNIDGTYEYSNTVSVFVKHKNTIATVIPNPVRDKAIVRFGKEVSENAQLELITATGHLIQTYNIQGYSLEIDIHNLERGIYFLKIKNSDKAQKAFYKIVKY